MMRDPEAFEATLTSLDKKPHIDTSVFVANGAQIIGDVTIAKNASIWYNVVIRGDMAHISIGENTNVQDGSVIHIDHGYPNIIGNNVTIGHNATIHGVQIADNVLIGMNAVLLGWSEIGKGSIIGAGCVIKPNMKIPPRSLVVGVPGKIIRNVTDEEYQDILTNAEHYNTLRQRYLKKFPN